MIDVLIIVTIKNLAANEYFITNIMMFNLVLSNFTKPIFEIYQTNTVHAAQHHGTLVQ
jgi:hypothetical protein